MTEHLVNAWSSAGLHLLWEAVMKAFWHFVLKIIRGVEKILKKPSKQNSSVSLYVEFCTCVGG